MKSFMIRRIRANDRLARDNAIVTYAAGVVLAALCVAFFL